MNFTLLLFSSFSIFILSAFVADIGIYNSKHHGLGFPYYFTIALNFIGMTLFILSFILGF